LSSEAESHTRTAEVDAPAGQAARRAIRIAALLFFLTGIGWPLGGLAVTLHMIRTGTRPLVFGIHALEGPWTAVYDHQAIVVLHAIFLALTAVELLAGYWLWKFARKGAVLGLALQPLEAIFWYGFALPIPPLMGLLKMVLLASGWKRLR
jgi:hypothetical protein